MLFLCYPIGTYFINIENNAIYKKMLLLKIQYVIYICEIISGEHFMVVWSDTSYLLQQYYQAYRQSSE